MNQDRIISIPLDVLEVIVDRLCDDKAALKRCSLASRCFLRPTRRRLFSTVRLDSSRTCLRFHNLLERNSQLICYIHRLEVAAKKWPALAGVENWLTSDGLILVDVLRVLHDSVDSFDLNLRFHTTFFNEWPLKLQFAILAFLKSSRLIDISIVNVQRFPISHFTECPQLKRLKLQAVSPLLETSICRGTALPTTQLMPFQNHGGLETLTICVPGRTVAFFIEAMTCLHSLLGLASLRGLFVYGNMDPEVTQKVTNTAGQSLESFTWSETIAQTGEKLPIVLGWNLNVRHLTLGTMASQMQKGPLSWLFPSLESVTVHHALEELTIQIRWIVSSFHAERVGKYDLWGCLDALLTRPVFSRLRRVKVELRELYDHGNDPTRAVQSQMPLLNAAGILEINTDITFYAGV